MTDSFAALVKAMARAVCKCGHPWSSHDPEDGLCDHGGCGSLGFYDAKRCRAFKSPDPNLTTLEVLLAAAFDARGPCEECDGEGQRFIVGCHGSDEECPACDGSGLGQPVIVGALVERGILDGTIEHLVKFDVDGWTLQHPLSERLAGSLFECEWNDRLSALDGPPPEGFGIYAVEWDGRDIAYVSAKRS